MVAQGLVPVGVGQESAVEHQVHVERHPVLEAERDDRGPHGAPRFLSTEYLDEPDPQLIHIELTGVHHQVGPVPEPLQKEPLVGDRVDHATGGLGVAPAGAFEPPDEHVVGGVEEQDAHPVPPRLERIHRGQHVIEVSPAAAHDEGHTLHLRTRAVDQLGHLGDQGRRHVVDDEPAEVLQSGRRRRTAGPGHAGHHQVLAHPSTLARLSVDPFGDSGVCNRSNTAAPTSAGNHDTPIRSSSEAPRSPARPPN